MGHGWQTARALRYRSGQAIALFVLSVLAVGTVAFGPFYQRAVEAAELRRTLSTAPADARGLSVHTGSISADPTTVLSSADVRRFFRDPVRTVQAPVSYVVGTKPVDGLVVDRSGLCGHVVVTAGRCPTRPTEVLAGVPAAQVLGLAVGTRLTMTGVVGNEPAVVDRATVVGLYHPVDSDGDYWFGRPFFSAAGAQETNGDVPRYQADALLSGPGLAESLSRVPIPQDAPQPDLGVQGDSFADAALSVGSVHLDDIGTLDRVIRALRGDVDPAGAGAVSRLDTSLDFLLTDVGRGRRQARTVIPAFAAEAAVLLVVVIGIVVVAAADDRRPEIALARLRGRSVGSAAWMVERELGAAVAAGVVPGVLIAWLLADLACRTWLSGRAHAEWREPVVVAAGAIAAAALLVVAVSVRRAAAQPVQDMLRLVPRRTSRRGLGAIEAALVAAAIAGIAVVFSGDRNNALVVLTPSLIALVAGLALGRVVGAIAGRAGRRAFWAGRLSRGLAGVQVVRRAGARRVVTLICVATALIVSTAAQWTVAASNRSVRAGVQAGASVVLTVHAAGPQDLLDAVRRADPAGEYAAAVVTQRPVNGPPLIAVDPRSVGRVGAWGWSADRPAQRTLDALDPPRPPPVQVRANALTLELASTAVRRAPTDAGQGSHSQPLALLISLTRTDGTSTSVRLGPVPDNARPAVALTGQVDCAAGCTLRQIALVRSAADTDDLDITLPVVGLFAVLAGHRTPVPLGSAAQWASATAPVQGVGPTQTIDLEDRGMLTLVANNRGAPAVVQHLAVPIAVPAYVVGNAGQYPDERGFISANSVDGLAAYLRPLGAMRLAPTVGDTALVVGLATAASAANRGLGDSTASVWLARDDSDRERTLVDALAQRGVQVTGRDTAAGHRADLAASAPAWAIQFALAGALVGLLVAPLVIVLAATSSRRGRAADLGALRLVGVPSRRLRRAALLEQTAAPTIAVLAGAAVGVLGARLALPSIPLFVRSADVPPVHLPIPWTTVAVTTVATCAVVVGTGVLVAVLQTPASSPRRAHGTAS